MSATLDLAIDLIQRDSITPDDKGCQALLAERLAAIGFHNQSLRFGDVDNLWSQRGKTAPLFVFAGHTDVVPTGPETDWQHPPFAAICSNGKLYGRGTADMKGSIAAMLTACERFIKQHPDHQGSIGFLITSDEEGPATDGTVKVIEHLQQQQQQIDWCLVGEPSSEKSKGDVVKNGRRGSLTGYLSIKGTQGHVAYPHLADNPVHRLAPFLQTLVTTEWDQGNDHFPATTLQIVQLEAGTGATNVIPGSAELIFNIRYSTETDHQQLQKRILALLEQHQINYEIKWTHSGKPFLTPAGKLVEAVQNAIQSTCGYKTQLSTAGGTSDGRFIAPTGAQVIELGPLNATIHKVNECVSISDLDTLSTVYQQILEQLLLPTT